MPSPQPSRRSSPCLHWVPPREAYPKAKEAAFDVYDPSFFVAFGFAKEAPVKIAGTPGIVRQT